MGSTRPPIPGTLPHFVGNLYAASCRSPIYRHRAEGPDLIEAGWRRPATAHGWVAATVSRGHRGEGNAGRGSACGTGDVVVPDIFCELDSILQMIQLRFDQITRCIPISPATPVHARPAAPGVLASQLTNSGPFRMTCAAKGGYPEIGRGYPDWAYQM